MCTPTTSTSGSAIARRWIHIARGGRGRTCQLLALLLGHCLAVSHGAAFGQVVDTGQVACYDNMVAMTCPDSGQSFYGQDAHYSRNTPSYTDNLDGTVTDLVTGLMWQKSPDMDGSGTINYSDKKYFDDALAGAASFGLAGYTDWRLPTITELYSLIMFNGAEPSPNAPSCAGCIPFIDTTYFDFAYGDLGAGERIIDAQYASATVYVSTTMNRNRTMFGVNFADGRIKGYPADTSIGKRYYVRYVRDNASYGTHAYVDNANGTVTDGATGLMWTKNDNGAGVLWEDALSYAENREYAGYTDWRLPSAKELQSLVDYTRSPATTGSAAIDAVFNCTSITNEAGASDYPYYWSSTTFSSLTPTNGTWAVYVSFGRAMGYMAQFGGWIDVHGAGAQRSDPKTGDPATYPRGHGPQGDAVRIYNYVRLVRDANGPPTDVILSELTAVPQGRAILLRWRASAVDFVAFDVLRAAQGSGPLTKLGAAQRDTGLDAWTYLDTSVASGTGYTYYVVGQSSDGSGLRFGPVTTGMVPDGTFELGPTWPFPARETVTARFRLPRQANVKVEIYNVRGRRVRLLLDDVRGPGMHWLEWDGRSEAGALLPSGLYFVRLSWSGGALTTRAILLR